MRAHEIRVARPPERPLMIFDGRCGFCRRWIDRWRQLTGDAIDYAPSQDARIATDFPEIPADRFQSAVQLVEPDGRVTSGACAVFRAHELAGVRAWPARAYERSSLCARAADAAYGVVAGHRNFFDRVTTLLWGHHLERPSHGIVRDVFLRGLGLVYLVAFISLWTQIRGLIGHDGILPAASFIDSARQFFDAQQIGLDRYRLLPTLCWWFTSDASLAWQCAAGVIAAVLLVLGLVPGLCLAVLWALYLSLVTIGRDFLGFQWDNLLLEAGFLAIFFAPWSWRLRAAAARARPPSTIALWLLRWLLFRLMFESGSVKILSGDPNWRNLTALTFHYQTQPLPTWIGWYANQLPLVVQKISCAGVFAIELAAPFLIFTPRRPRMLGAALLAALQGLILLTGNYTFFNWLTILLCVLLLDDAAIAGLLPARLRRRAAPVETNAAIVAESAAAGAVEEARVPIPSGGGRRLVARVAGAVLVLLSLVPLLAMWRVEPRWMSPVAAVDGWIDPFRTVNGYGLFAVMTTSREEIVVEGSDDGRTWRPYAFKYKPGDVMRRPGFVAPFQPRLDWQMWFAALSTWRENPWFQNFCLRLLQGSPSVIALLATNPFPDHPPRYIRAELYDYRFTDLATKRATGAWWTRTPAGEYLPQATLPR